jgi:hypothetical protein
LIPGNGTSGVVAELGGTRGGCGPAIDRIDQTGQAALRVTPPIDLRGPIFDRHSFPFPQTSTPRLAMRGTSRQRQFARIIDHINPDGRIT